MFCYRAIRANILFVFTMLAFASIMLGVVIVSAQQPGACEGERDQLRLLVRQLTEARLQVEVANAGLQIKNQQLEKMLTENQSHPEKEKKP